MAQDTKSIVMTDSLIAVVAGNPGLTISINDLVNASTAPRPLRGGCIRYLRYGSSAEDLDRVVFDNGDTITEADAANLKDFRENFECAAKFGMGATFCLIQGRISMVNLYPCLCTCPPEEGKGHGRPATDFIGLSGQ